MMFLLVLSNVVSAQVRPSTFSVTPYLGGFLFDKEQNLHNAPVYGISLGYNFTKYFGAELSGEFIDTKYDRTDVLIPGQPMSATIALMPFLT